MQRQRMAEEWLSLAGSSARLFRLGEEVREGQYLGQAWGSHEPLRAPFDGRVVGIEYDIWRDAVIVVVAQGEDRQSHARPNRLGPHVRTRAVQTCAVA